MTESVQLVEHLFRHQAGQITAGLVRVLGFQQLDLIEDVIQDALLKALKTWPYSGLPDNPAGWLSRVAKNRAIDVLRRDRNWSEKTGQVAQYFDQLLGPPEPLEPEAISDDQLQLMFACCHPAINPAARIALTLKAVGGFSVAEIASAFLAREATVAQRLVRAKRHIREHAINLDMPGQQELPARLDSVLQVIYLMFNEGYGASQGDALVRRDLCFEAIRLGECLIAHAALAQPRVHALMALLYFQAARLDSRADHGGDLIVLSEQDRSVWNPALIRSGAHQLRQAASGEELSRYHLEAEISACHTLSPSFAATDWKRIADCYELLYRQDASLVVAVNRAAALLYASGPQDAYSAIDALAEHPQADDYYPYHVTRAAIAGQLGRYHEQQASLQRAMQTAGSAPVKRFLIRKLAAAETAAG